MVKKRKTKKRGRNKGYLDFVLPRFFRLSRYRAWWIGGLSFLGLYVWLFYVYFVGPMGFRWRALYGEREYPNGYSIRGLDISRYQGEIDWEALSQETINDTPIRFIFIKSTEGSTQIDRYFNDNFYQAKRYGFMRGAYHFWSNKSSSRAQAYHFLKQVHLEEGDLPPVLDIEHFPEGRSVEDFRRDVLTWLHIVEDKYHVKPIIYTYYKFKMKYLNTPVFDNYPYWIAHYYVDELDYKGRWHFWQHTDVGKLNGIKGYVDLNIYNGSYYELMRMAIGANN